MVVDKRVFDIAAEAQGGSERRLLAIGADSTVLDLFLAMLGAFRWRGDYDLAEREYYRVVVEPRVFEFGKGSRTPLRRVLDVGTEFSLSAPGIAISAQVAKSYVVQSRRHYPKVIDGGGPTFDAQGDTWTAQSAMRREFRGSGAAQNREFGTPASRDEVEAQLHGFFSAIVSGPMLMPSEWVPRLLEMGSFADLQEARDVMAAVMSKYNTVARQLLEDRDEFMRTVERFADIDEGEGSIAWARGYFEGIAMRVDEWDALARQEGSRKLMAPIGVLYFECGRDPEKRAWLRDVKFRGDISHASALAAIGLWEEWRGRLFGNAQPVRRNAPKISPNAPCPCGSGKKYKRCCSPLRAV